MTEPRGGLAVPPPPPPVPESSLHPPPPPPPSISPVQRFRSRPGRAAFSALLLAGVGWFIFVFSTGAELDTGYPDGLACTGSPIDSTDYANCMGGSESAGAIAWSVTLALGLTGMVMLGRTRQPQDRNAGSMWLIVPGWIASGSLTAAGIGVMALGASGALYEDRVGSTAWLTVGAIAGGIGLLAGWKFTPSAGDLRPTPPGPTREVAPAAVIAWLIGTLVVLSGMAVFMFGDKLFGSDDSTIDDYNRETLASCAIPEGSTLIGSFTVEFDPSDGGRLRGTGYIWASPSPAANVAEFFELDELGVQRRVTSEQACKFSQRPWVLVLGFHRAELNGELDPATQTAGVPMSPDDPFWGGVDAEVITLTDPPSDTQSFFRLTHSQRLTEGLFGLAPDSRLNRPEEA